MARERRVRRARLGLVTAAAIVVALLLLVGVRALVANPGPTLGPTAAADLVLGSCLLENGPDLDRYTVIDCNSSHPQQVVASMDLTVAAESYTSFESVSAFAVEVCNRYLEYGLFIRPEAQSTDFALAPIAVPTRKQFTAGRTTALCAITAADGSQLAGSLYRPMP